MDIRQFIGIIAIVMAIVIVTIVIYLANRNKCLFCNKSKLGWQFKHKFRVNPYDSSIFEGVCNHCVRTNNNIRKKHNGDFEVYSFITFESITVTKEEIHGSPSKFKLHQNTIARMGGDVKTITDWKDDGNYITCLFKKKGDDQWMQFSTCSKSDIQS